MPINEALRDTTALGGLALYSFVAALFLVLERIEVFSALVVGIVLCYAIIVLVRLVFFRKRPDKQKFKGWLTKIDAGSFPSMHSTRATVLAFVLWQVFTEPFIRILLVLGVLSVISTRVLLGRHYVSDVIAGVVLGLVIGWASVALAGLA